MEAAWLALRQRPAKAYKVRRVRPASHALVVPHAELQVLGEHEMMNAMLRQVEGRLTSHNLRVGALDMGGGSVEVVRQRSEAAALRLWELARMSEPGAVAGQQASLAYVREPRTSDAVDVKVMDYYARKDACHLCASKACTRAHARHKMLPSDDLADARALVTASLEMLTMFS